MLKASTRQRSRARGRVLYELIDARTGKIIERGKFHNIITRTGLGLWDTALFTSPPNLIDTCKVGKGLTVPADTDSALTSLVESKAISNLITTNVTGATPYIIARTQFDEDEAVVGGSDGITEVGLFLSGSGAMFNHAFFGSGTITGATKADPCVITCANHGLVDGQRVRIQSVGGMVELNNNLYYVDELSSSTFALYNDAALSDTVDSTGFTTYTSGGTFIVSIPKTNTTILVVRIEVQLANA
jgi:hypothetical protein